MGRPVKLERTTPEADDLQRLLSDMVDAGVEISSLEVSSHALELGRVAGTRFEVVAFTNLSQDHLDFHGDMESYFEAKARLFEPGRARCAVIWVDDPAGARLAASTTLPVIEVGVGTGEVRARGVASSWEGIGFTLVTPAGTIEVALPLRGRFNLANALVAAAIAIQLDLGLDAVAAGLGDAPVIPGRFERVLYGQPFEVVVDYAHTPASIEEAVAAARGLTDGAVVVVFGAGGDRDRAKRPLMGQAASSADRVVVTSDNPRSEDPGRSSPMSWVALTTRPAGWWSRIGGWPSPRHRRSSDRATPSSSWARGTSGDRTWPAWSIRSTICRWSARNSARSGIRHRGVIPRPAGVGAMIGLLVAGGVSMFLVLFTMPFAIRVLRGPGSASSSRRRSRATPTSRALRPWAGW